MGKKNNTQKTIVHFDLGGSKISGVAGIVEENGALTVLGEERRDSEDNIKSGLIEKVNAVAYRINELTKLLQNSLRIEPIQTVSISVNPKSMKLSHKTIHHPIERTVTPELLKKVKRELKAAINSDKVYVYSIDELEYFVDGRPYEDPVGIKGNDLRVDYQVVAGNKLVQESIERCFDRTGIAVDYIHLGVDALSTAVLDDEDRENGCAVIAFGATSTTLAVYNEGKLQDSFMVPFGGLNITKDIQELGIKYEYAELLKCKKGSALESCIAQPVNIKAPSVDPEKEHVMISTAFLATIIESRLTEIMEPIFDIINQITYRLQNGIIITGGGSKLLNLKEFITEKTGFQVREGNHTEWLSEETDEKFFQPEYAQAVGAMILTHDLMMKKKADEEAAIEPKIKKGLFGKMGKIISDNAQRIFEYEEMNSGQNDNNQNQTKE